MVSSGFLLCFFPSESSAREAFRQLCRWRYRRTALVRKSSQGALTIRRAWPRLFTILCLFLGTAFSLSSVYVLFRVGLENLTAEKTAFIIFSLAVGLAALASPIFFRFAFMGIDREVLGRYVRCLVSGESVLVVQASATLMSGAISVLRRVSKDQPTIFAFHPSRDLLLTEFRRFDDEPLSPLKFRSFARTLAESHATIMGKGRETPLLRHLDTCERILNEVHQILTDASHLEQSISTSAEWILDNSFILHNHISDVRKNLPRRFYRELPILKGGSYCGLPRIYAIACELVFHTAGQLDRHIINDFLDAYQTVSHLTTGELWAFPLLLRISLVDNLCRLSEKVDLQLREGEAADFWANRLIVATRNEPDLLFGMLMELTREISEPSVNFGMQLVEHLYDEEAALKPVQGWLERKLEENLESTFLHEKTSQSNNEASIGNTFTSLRWLKQVDWRNLFEKQSRVENALRKDPAGIYPHMDFATRDSYRHAVESISKAGGDQDEDVARTAVSLAEQHKKQHGDAQRQGHVGYYLVDDGRQELTRLLRTREDRRYRTLTWVYKHHSLIYFGSLFFTTLVFLLPLWISLPEEFSVWMTLLLTILTLFPATQISVQLINYIVTHILPPRTLPKMNFEKGGIPEAYLTLVVVPTLLTGKSQVRSDIESLEIRYQANPDPNLFYALFTDFTDAPEPTIKSDEALLGEAVKGIKRLNGRYGLDRFYLLHRDREWSDSESCYMGWERKRGKLEDLHRFLNNVPPRTGQGIVKVGSPDRLSRVRYVITLDSDTQLPRDSARRMVETIAHPLNQPVIDPESGLVKKGYTIVQPRVSTSLPSSTATRFSRLFTDPVGTDPYTTAISDVYQDLGGEGSFIGKGIYDPKMFHSVLTGRFPERSILSHDLIEGSYVRAGLASDIELLDEFPSDYTAYCIRAHRWTRGDWQIADWVLPWVTDGRGRRVRNPLSIFNRWKILDNLRRSLVAPASFLLLVVSWNQPAGPGIAGSVLVGISLLSTPILDLVTWSLAPIKLMTVMPGQILRNLELAFASASLMVHQAWLVSDAVLRVWYRRLISHRGMLQWTAAQAVQTLKSSERAKRLIFRMIPFSTLSGLAVVYAGVSQHPVRFALYPYLFLWFLSPLLIWRLSMERPSRVSGLSGGDRKFLRRIARRTWRTFDDLVGHQTNWLPADNYQVSHMDELARRTSPTNIGLYLLSVLAAEDFGYISPLDTVMRIKSTLGTMEQLQLYEGHLLNWYDLDSLQPLHPMYVSTVDSGNLIGCLWTLNQGLREMIDKPLLDVHIPLGIADTAAVLKESMIEVKVKRSLLTKVEDLIRESESLSGPDKWDIVGWLHRATAQAQEIRAVLEEELSTLSAQRENGAAPDNGNPKKEVHYWAAQLLKQCLAWSETANSYLAWLEETPAHVGDGSHFISIPSIRQLAEEDHPLIKGARENRNKGESAPVESRRSTSFAESLDASVWNAMDFLKEVEQAIETIRDFTDRINMRFLYDTRKRIFHIGFNVSDQRHDTSFYDLLASEARLASFIAVARGEVPAQHWMALGRPFGSVGRRKVLLSWGGTMFEYLMPQLFLKEHQNSLITAANQEAINLQIDFARRQGVPWGISESAYADLDASRVYQYRSFGVPGLGLKRGLEDDLVVSPYSSILALPYRPRDVVDNLRYLKTMGLLAGHGFYEAIDFTRQQKKGEAGVVVRTFMAHHQGMAFLSLDNFLNGNMIQRRFHSDIRVRATEPLLFERIPATVPVYDVPLDERAPSSATPIEIRPSESKFDTPHTETPKTQILSNGNYSVLITNSGAGYSRWKDVELTRWQADTTRDNWGLFCYIQDLDSGRRWSNCYQPVGGKMDNYVASFALDRAEIRRSDRGVETETEVIVSPEDDAEIRRISLINRSGIRKKLQVTTYLEPVLAEHRADIIHPAFNKIFIRTEVDDEGPSLLATRRPRSDEESEIWMGHQLTQEIPNSTTPVQWETDRSRFLGRGRTTADPQAMSADLSGSTGMMLDPILSMRRTVTVEPGQRTTLYLTLCAGENREQVTGILRKYREPENIRRERDLTWRQAQLELRHLRIQPEEARHYQHLASYMIYPNDKLRPSKKRLGQNALGQSRLWSYGISGDLPVLALTIGSEQDIGIVNQALQAHTYWRRHGLMTDLVILNEESYSYDQPLHNLLFRMVRNYAPYSGMDEPGGIYLRFVDQIPEEDLVLILASARVVLVAARGHLTQQIGGATLKRGLPRKITATASSVKDLPSALPPVDLQWDNGTGGFTPDGTEYVIDLDNGSVTPAPWVNVLSNPDFGTLISESGSGYTWYGNSQRNRLTTWSNDGVSDPPSEVIYVRDEETGDFWTPTLLPKGGDGPRRVHHGQGYSVFLHNTRGLDQELTVFVPVLENHHDPVKVQRFRIRNTSERTRHLSVTCFAELLLGEVRETSQMHVVTNWDPQSRVMLAQNPYNEDYGDMVAFAFMGPTPDSCTGDREEFLGRNGSLADPTAMRRMGLSGRTGPGLDPCSAIQVILELEPGGSEDIICLLGQAESKDEARKIVKRYGNKKDVQVSLDKTKEWWNSRLSRVSVSTPEQEVNILLNRWLPYQILSCRLWARTGFYQSGGAYGFRDQLQDVLSLLHMEPSWAREHILLAAGRQFREGDVQHWWHPPSGSGIRSRCSDDLLWLPYAVSQYVAFTGDIDILNEHVAFIEGDPLEDEDEVFMVPNQSLDRGTLYEHCCRAVSRGVTEGPHKLPLIGIGDWNDGMSRVGVAGRGESVWLAWFLKVVLEGMAFLAERLDQTDDAREFRGKADELVSAAEKHAWDGKWYRRAYHDDGSPIGSIQNEEVKIDSIAQSWSVISRGGDPKRAEEAMNSAWSHLFKEEEKLTLLLTPPFDHTSSDPGYIKGYPPGVRENGGQYSHAAAWLAKAFAMIGDGERAAKILKTVNPVYHALDRDGMERYKTEPYAVAADIYRLEGNVGKGGWSWYTGAAGWLYRVWIEDLLGLRVSGDFLRVDPVIPPGWEGFSLQYSRGNTLYNITVENPENVGKGVSWVKMDDRTLPDRAIPIVPVSTFKELRHNIVIRMGSPI